MIVPTYCKTVDVLMCVKNLLDSPDKWIKTFEALDDKGRGTHPKSQEACKWCLDGAVNASSADSVTYITTMRILDRCLDDNNSVSELIAGGEAVSYNDLPETTYIDIISLVDKAIERIQ